MRIILDNEERGVYVCICNAITDKQIHEAADAGVKDLWGLQAALGVATNCGSCKETAAEILREKRRKKQFAQPQVYCPSVA